MKTGIPYDDIAKHLRKDASPEEREQLRLWIAESEENRKLYKQILKTWKLQDALAFHPKKEEAWRQLEHKLDLQDVAKGRRIFLRRTMQFAAVILVLLGIGILFQPTDFLFGEKMLALHTTTEQQSVVLADGTEVFLNRNSDLTYPVSFDGDKRQVILKGEAFFKVARNPEKPFIIKTAQTKTKILGTSFNLRAYAYESSETLSVVTGKVAFSSLRGKAEVILTPKQVGAYSLDDGKMSKQALKDPNVMAWLDKVFVFNDQSLESIVRSLSRAYGVSIEIQNSSLAKEHLSTSFNALSLDDVLSILSQTLDFEYSRVDSENIIIK